MLKRLTLTGFKSFATKTDFVFEPGLTTIVGPNGCGKSNVVDALKWVLGEQSARSLRGTEMQDVIFAGSGSRPALGCAEATLTFDNHGRRLPNDSDEVVVTRRLYRSGQSEYLLNGQPCRLRDIRDLIMDTGIGRSAYSVVEQGKVDQLLQANPTERRVIFEEAAGISKYKARRRDAENKLTRVEQNLLRLGDIIDEVERQLRSIRYQAAKARRYRKHADRLREFRLAQAARDFSTYQDGRRALRGRIEEHSRGALTLAGRLRGLEAHQSATQTSLLELEQELNRGRVTSVELRTRASRSEQAITLTEHRLEELTHEEASLAGQLARLAQTVSTIQADLRNSEEQGVRLRDRLLVVGNDLARAREERNLLDLRRQKLERQLQDRRAVVLQFTQQLTQRENDRRSLDAERAGLSRDRQRLRDRQQELSRELDQLDHQERALAHTSQQAQHRCQELSGELQRFDRALAELGQESRRRQQELELARREEASKRGRLRVLSELEANLEGVDLAVRKLLERRGGDPAQQRVQGILAQLIGAPTEYSTAVDAALGPAAQAVVTSTLAEALSCRAALSEAGSGRVQFLPLERASRSAPGPPADVPMGSRVVGWLGDLVTVADPYRPLVDNLLGTVLLVEDIEAGLELQLELTRPIRLVTKNGELIEPDGRLVLGSGQAGVGLVSRRSQINDLERELSRLEADIARRQSDLKSRAARIEELKTTRQRLLNESAQTEEAVRRSALSLEQLRTSRSALGQEGEVLASEIGEVEAQLTSLQRRRQDLGEEIAALAAQRGEEEQAMAERVGELQEAEARDEVLGQAMTELKIALAQVEEQYASTEVTLANLKKARREREEERTYTLTQLEICRQRQASGRQEVVQARSTLSQAQQELTALEQSLTGLETRRAQLRQQLSTNNEEAKKVRASLDSEEDELQKLELADSELRLKQESVCERIAEEYQVTLADHLEELLSEERDWEAVAEEVIQLRQKISRLGNVNLDAIDEEEQLVERARFLHEQREDLQRSKATLQRVIARINRRCREMFLETFQAVRTHFQELFRKLFGGGRADIFLADEHDVLESGIEIVAKPPGKEPKTISLLSGGEKTLAAVAILFAIFRSKPSPFCILDEVDAAMDEANVERFLAVLREFLQESQFIVITHCKRTMAEADIIYGITMQEPGVSARVAVKLEEAEALVA